MGKFKISGINYPGRVVIKNMGEMNLHHLSDDKLEELYVKGLCGYIQPIDNNVANKAPISNKVINVENNDNESSDENVETKKQTKSTTSKKIVKPPSSVP